MSRVNTWEALSALSKTFRFIALFRSIINPTQIITLERRAVPALEWVSHLDLPESWSFLLTQGSLPHFFAQAGDILRHFVSCKSQDYRSQHPRYEADPQDCIMQRITHRNQTGDKGSYRRSTV